MPRVDMGFWDPDGADHGIPTYPWGHAPTGLATRRQLRARQLSPGGHGPVAQLLAPGRRGSVLVAYLYDEQLARPKRRVTAAVHAAVGKALAARRTCSSCGQQRDYVISRRLGECNTCAEHAGHLTAEPASDQQQRAATGVHDLNGSHLQEVTDMTNPTPDQQQPGHCVSCPKPPVVTITDPTARPVDVCADHAETAIRSAGPLSDVSTYPERLTEAIQATVSRETVSPAWLGRTLKVGMTEATRLQRHMQDRGLITAPVTAGETSIVLHPSPDHADAGTEYPAWAVKPITELTEEDRAAEWAEVEQETAEWHTRRAQEAEIERDNAAHGERAWAAEVLAMSDQELAGWVDDQNPGGRAAGAEADWVSSVEYREQAFEDNMEHAAHDHWFREEAPPEEITARDAALAEAQAAMNTASQAGDLAAFTAAGQRYDEAYYTEPATADDEFSDEPDEDPRADGPSIAEENAWTESAEWSAAGAPADWVPVTDSEPTAQDRWEDEARQAADDADRGEDRYRQQMQWLKAEHPETFYRLTEPRDDDRYQDQMERLEVEDPDMFDRIIADSNRRLAEGADLYAQTVDRAGAADPIEAAQQAVTELREASSAAGRVAHERAETSAADAYREQQAYWARVDADAHQAVQDIASQARGADQ